MLVGCCSASWGVPFSVKVVPEEVPLGVRDLPVALGLVTEPKAGFTLCISASAGSSGRSTCHRHDHVKASFSLLLNSLFVLMLRSLASPCKICLTCLLAFASRSSRRHGPTITPIPHVLIPIIKPLQSRLLGQVCMQAVAAGPLSHVLCSQSLEIGSVCATYFPSGSGPAASLAAGV